MIGDEVMFVADEAIRRREIAVDLVDAFHDEKHRLPRPAPVLRAGQVLVHGGDFFGPVVEPRPRGSSTSPDRRCRRLTGVHDPRRPPRDPLAPAAPETLEGHGPDVAVRRLGP